MRGRPYISGVTMVKQLRSDSLDLAGKSPPLAELSERSRFQAQNDSDFANLLEDPRFTELLYPEKPI